MTDAERIAEYLNEQECGNPWTVNEVKRRITDPSTQCHDLARLLADVRREEREACLADIANEVVAAENRKSKATGRFWDCAVAQLDALRWAIKHIRERGSE